VGIDEPKEITGNATGGTGGANNTGGTGGNTGGTGGQTGLDPTEFGCNATQAPVCGEYCQALEANCVGADLQQYSDERICLSVCCGMELGTETDTDENSVHCRLKHATAAGTVEPEVECPAAGPGGEDDSGNAVCGDECDAFCAQFRVFCPDDFDTLSNCLLECEGLEDDEEEGYNFIDYQDGGGSVECRLYHVNAAAFSPSPHCNHAAGRQICVSKNTSSGAGGAGGAD
jgi:hypothetical protein